MDDRDGLFVEVNVKGTDFSDGIQSASHGSGASRSGHRREADRYLFTFYLQIVEAGFLVTRITSITCFGLDSPSGFADGHAHCYCGFDSLGHLGHAKFGPVEFEFRGKEEALIG